MPYDNTFTRRSSSFSKGRRTRLLQNNLTDPGNKSKLSENFVMYRKYLFHPFPNIYFWLLQPLEMRFEIVRPSQLRIILFSVCSVTKARTPKKKN